MAVLVAIASCVAVCNKSTFVLQVAVEGNIASGKTSFLQNFENNNWAQVFIIVAFVSTWFVLACGVCILT